ncbi:7TM diverse intracellular signaling domain-containing protein [Oligoflexus tunisiensis]|uniref:7TM diverse intracellular signaling domain-containing protein n=1 Tax=Oligoflexus tunisiensis TaxID=708132 RepID=UPI00114CAEB2|nr:7TM diverse intracellular signaling domain-containing protein [Oligoflexus tunisiensis]
MRFLFTLFLTLGLSFPCMGFTLQPDTEQVVVGNFNFLADPTRQLTLEEIRTRTDWKVNEKGSFNFGFSKDSYWITFQVTNAVPELRQWILELEYAPLDFIDLHVVHKDGRVTHKRAGDRLPFAERDIEYRSSNFILKMEAQETVTVYLNIRSESSIHGPIVLWSPQGFIEKASHELTGFSLYTGLMLAMLLYNLFLFLTIRDKSYLYYVLYVLFYGYTMTSVFGLSYQYVTPEAPALANLMVPVSIALGSIFVILFAQEFLKLNQYSVWMPRLFKFFYVWAGCALAATPFSYALSIKLASGLTMIGAPCVFIAGVACLGKGYRPAYFFVLAFSLFLIGITINQMLTFGLVEPSLFARYSGHFGSTAEMILLSIALGDKIKYEQNQTRREIVQLNKDLKEVNEHLESRVEEQTRDIRSMLQHIRLGIFTIVEGGQIHKDYSSFLQRIFQRQDLAGARAADLLFEGSDVGSDTRSQVNSILQSTLGEPECSFDLNEGSLLKEIRKTGPDGQARILEIDWSPIVNRRELIEKILVTIRDVTQFRELQEDANLKKKELEFIAEIVPISREQFARFLSSTDKHIEENERLIQANATKSLEALKIILINLHTLKGTARALGLRKLSEIVHEAEHYAALLQSGQADWKQDLLRRDLELVKATFEYYRHVNDQVLERASNRSSIELDIAKVEAILNEIAGLHQQPLSSESRSLFQKIDFMLSKAFLQPASLVLHEILISTQRLARDLNKEAPKLVITDNGFFLTRDGAELLRNVLSHLTRNSMDHGIETREERRAIGKAPQGTITVTLAEDKDGLILRYQDDGRGLGLQMIRTLAMIRGLVDRVDNLSREELAHLIFIPGFSTSQAVNEISGRGMGMSAIKTYTENAGGTLTLELGSADPMEDFIPFTLVMHMPARYYRSFPESFLKKERGSAAA